MAIVNEILIQHELISLYGKDIPQDQGTIDELLIIQETIKQDLKYKLQELTSDL
jgi:hypothetical protein